MTRHDVRFAALVNAHYHAVRRGFFERVHRWLMFAAILGGSGAAIFAARDPMIALPLALVPALATAADLAFNLFGKAAEHALLQRRYYEVLAELREGDPGDPGDPAPTFAAALYRIYADEPVPMRALQALAYNATLVMIGDESTPPSPVTGWQRWTANLFTYAGHSFDPPKAG